MGRNTNCLEGLRCPACGNEDELHIRVQQWVSLTDDGTDPYAGNIRDPSPDWDDDSLAECPRCWHEGPLSAFRIDEEEKEG